MFTLEWEVGERRIRWHKVEGVLLGRTVIVREEREECIRYIANEGEEESEMMY